MKKLLSLLNVLTISGSAIPTTIAASPYQKEENIISDISYSQTNNNLKNLNRVKRQTQRIVPSLKNIISTVYIGEIQKNNQEQIIQRLRENNHPILSRSDFLEHIVFENITGDSAIVHASQNIYVDDHAYSIPSSLNFTINFILRPLLSTIIRNRHLGVIPVHAYSIFRLDDIFVDYGSILEALRRVNPNLNGVDSNIMQYIRSSYNGITETRLALTQEGQNFYEQDYVILNYNDHLSTDFLNSLFPNGILRNNLNELQLGELSDNRSDTILNRIRQLSPGFNINYFVVENITVNSATIRYENNNGDFASFRLDYSFNVTFNLNKNEEQNLNINDNNDSNSSNNQKIKNIITKFNNLSKQSKQNKLNEINQHYQSLPENEQKEFKDKLRDVGLGLTSTGISGAGILGISKITGISPIKGLSTTANYIKNSLSTTRTLVSSETGEAAEMTPLLSESTVAEGLTAAETLSVTEVAAEADIAVVLAPETLGLSLVIGGLIIAGTALIWWFNDTNEDVTKHESHNQYNEIEKYYKFLAHDQLKLSISSDEWNKIKEIYEKTKNKEISSKHITNFIKECEKEITNFHKEDHSGWGGSIIDDDINTILEVIYFEFETINNHFLSNPNHGWKIITNTIGSYFIIEEE